MLDLGYARKMYDLALFTRHVAGAMKARVPLPEIVASYRLEADTRAMQDALQAILPGVESGDSLSHAMSKTGARIFPQSYIRLVRMGEESQTLPGVMAGLATALDEGISLQESFRRAAIYPCIVLMILTLEVAFIATKIMPRLMEILTSAAGGGGAAGPPLLSRIGGMMAVGATALLLFCFLWLLASGSGAVWRSKERGRFFLSLPLIGPALRLGETARFARHLGLMLENRIPLPDALGLIADSSVNGYVSQALLDFRERVFAGEQLGHVVASQPLFPPALATLVASAQETGQLPETLEQLAIFYRDRTTHALRVVREFFEPLMVILVGLIVAWMAFALYLPVMGLSRNMGPL